MLRIHLRDSRSLGPSMAELQLITPGVSLLKVSTSVPNLAKLLPGPQKVLSLHKSLHCNSSACLAPSLLGQKVLEVAPEWTSLN